MQHLFSPHFNHRPNQTTIDMIVIHAISLPESDFSMAYVEQLFCGQLDCTVHPTFADLQGLQVSAHFVIDRKGKLYQFVACDDRAWHAGISCWQGRENCNDFSIGIELIGDQSEPFTRAQYRECARLCHTLMQRYPDIEVSRIVGHQDIAPGRKWDPGRQWDWRRFRCSLSHIRHPMSGIR